MVLGGSLQIHVECLEKVELADRPAVEGEE